MRVVPPGDTGHRIKLSAEQLSAAMLAHPGQLGELLSSELGRVITDEVGAHFMHAEAASLRLGDISQLQAAYRDVALQPPLDSSS